MIDAAGAADHLDCAADSGLTGLVLLARFHGVAVDPDQLAHEFGEAGKPFGTAQILLAAKSLGLKAKAVRTDSIRLERTPLPALAIDKDDISPDQLWFRHVGSDLEVSVIGTDDTLTIRNWYSGSGSGYRVEQFRIADDHLLLDSQVENLVQAMAAFAPPGAGETTLPPGYQDTLAPVIAASWQ